jgi:hypothetical protein
MSKRNLTVSQIIHFAKASNCIESEFALHCYYHSTEVRPDSPYSSVLWSKQHDKISSAHGFGCLIGWDHAVRGWSEGMEIMSRNNYNQLKELYPEVEELIEKTPSDYYFVGGGTVMHTLASNIIEVSEDGLYAKASFYTPGFVYANLTPTKHQRCGWMWERYGQDWVFEDNEWRVLHNQVMLDFSCRNDNVNVGASTYRTMKESGWIWNGMMPGPPIEKDVPGPSNMDYWPVIVPQRTVMWPEPFKSYEDTWHYMPPAGDGHGEYRIPDLPNVTNGKPEM